MTCKRMLRVMSCCDFLSMTTKSIRVRLAACLCGLLALRLLYTDQFDHHSHGWGLLGSGAICFSIGCVCKVSWGLFRLGRAAALRS